MNYGFQPPVLEESDFKFGSSTLGGEIINEQGDWRPYLPQFEHQRKGSLDVQGCVSFGTLSALEMIHKLKWWEEPNYSDRYTAKASGTSRGGNTPKKVIHTIRHSGTLKEEDYPYNVTTWEEYYKDIPEDLIEKGKKWLTKYEIGYEYVDQKDLKEALKISPIGVAVAAWAKNENGEYYKFSNWNHWCVLVAFEGDNPIVWDSYEESLKKLSPDHELGFCMRYDLQKKKTKTWDFSTLLRRFKLSFVV